LRLVRDAPPFVPLVWWDWDTFSPYASRPTIDRWELLPDGSSLVVAAAGSLDDLPSVASNLPAATAKPQFDLAIRRYNQACARSSPEDQLIDCWIALEALFLPEKDELSYRASIRIARFVGQDPPERENLRKAIRDSYDLRSALVHGATPNFKKSSFENLSGAVDSTRDVLRRSLLRLLDTKSWNSAWVAEIDASLFGT